MIPGFKLVMDCHPLAPHHFRCPISLELMTDPVILSTGITYDRVSIEKWLSSGRNTCPATNQILVSTDLVPNVVLQKLIRAWCLHNNWLFSRTNFTAHAFPQLVSELLRNIEDGSCPVKTLKSLSTLALENEGNRDAIASIRGLRILSCLLSRLSNETRKWDTEDVETFREAVGVLCLLPLNDEMKFALTKASALRRGVKFLDEGDVQVKVNILRLLGNLARENHFLVRVCGFEGLPSRLFEVLRQDANPVLVETTLVTLCALCMENNFRATALNLGTMSRLGGLLQSREVTVCEASLEFLQLLLSFPEGCQAAANEVASIVPALTSTILGVSKAVTDHTVRILCKLCTDNSCCQEAIQNGAVAKALLLLQADCSTSTKRNAVELLHCLSKECKQVPYVYWQPTMRVAVHNGQETPA